MSRARLQLQLMLTELLIAIAEESAARQRARAEQCGLEGAELAQAITDLAVVESCEALRKAERKRLLAALSKRSPPDSSAEVQPHLGDDW